MRSVNQSELKQRVNLDNPSWYKEHIVPEDVRKVFSVEVYAPERKEKEGIVGDVVVSSVLGTFVFEGFYNGQTDCVSVQPKYQNTYVDNDGFEKTRTAVNMNYGLHAYVLQVLDGILS
jgi:hypothetical protein